MIFKLYAQRAFDDFIYVYNYGQGEQTRDMDYVGRIFNLITVRKFKHFIAVSLSLTLTLSLSLSLSHSFSLPLYTVYVYIYIYIY